MSRASHLLSATLAATVIVAGCSSSPTIDIGGEPTITAEIESPPDGDSRKVDNPVVDLDVTNDDDGAVATEQVRSLIADCESNSDLACDILLSISVPDSDNEAIALACGGRDAALDAFCTDDIDVTSEDSIWFDEDSAGLPALVTACEDGDMTSCDFLYFRSDFDSELEQIGNTCGGRIDVAIPDCRTALADLS